MVAALMNSSPSLADIRIAHARIAPHVHRTPILTSRLVDRETGAQLLFKCENLQRTGAFKARGAFNAVMGLSDNLASKGVVTHSSGNHAAALALAAATRGIPAYVVMPTTAPAVKKSAVLGYGAEVVECEPTLVARETAARAIVARMGATLIPPFDSDEVIAGQATCAIELLEDAERELDAVSCPVGGGGLLAGTAIACSVLSPRTQVIGAEPAAAGDAAAGFRTGMLQPQVLPVATIADGLTTAMSARTFAIMRKDVHDVVTVSEEAIVRAMRLLWSRMKIVVEASSAVPLAAVLEGAWDVRGKTVGIILTGGNVDLDRLPWSR
ncbi:threonine/serine dehydratase [Sandaracinobacteroides hominis]|uniref:threonine/serine dehydratase n=1 Tax=Sandaracinobacteroides hominis TaxID=2780086 RepID=UPI001F2F15D1|nr:threonine/serine dehydratase [Sandaracinobacteroides hominis]